MSDITRLLDAAAAGDRQAAAAVLPLVYAELRQLAAARVASEPLGHSLVATALVHEAYLRLVGPSDGERWDGRGHFFAAAAEAMRRILVDAARRRKAAKRGSGQTAVDLDPDQFALPEVREDLVALDDALNRLTESDPTKAELVKLRYFAGLTLEQAAEALGLSVRTAARQWAFARAWLRQEVEGDGEKSPGA